MLRRLTGCERWHELSRCGVHVLLSNHFVARRAQTPASRDREGAVLNARLRPAAMWCRQFCPMPLKFSVKRYLWGGCPHPRPVPRPDFRLEKRCFGFPRRPTWASAAGLGTRPTKICIGQSCLQPPFQAASRASGSLCTRGGSSTLPLGRRQATRSPVSHGSHFGVGINND